VYRRALRLGLDRESRRAALLCLASSYRVIGQFEPALRTVELARREYRDDPAVDSFHALVLLDGGEPRLALRVLGLALVREANPKAFGGFERALGRKFRGLTRSR
jgi:hypothetical protein